MPYTTIDVTRIKNQALSILNASRVTYGTPSDTKFRPAAHIDDAIKTADGIIYDTIKNNKNHYLRRLFYEQISIGDGVEITDTPIGGVWIDGDEGRQITLQALSELKRNRLNLSSIANGRYYAWAEGRGAINFIGTSCMIDVIKSMQGTFPLTPVELEMGVLTGVMAIVYPKEGEFTANANHYANMWQVVLRVLQSGDGSGDLPPVPIPRL